MGNRRYFYFVVITLLLTLSVITLGAYTRLSNAGLSCPDWPGCYGRLVLPSSHTALEKAQQSFPNSPIVPAKAWKEMIHRYSAGALGIMIFVLAMWSLVRRRKYPNQSVFVPCLLVGALAFQVILGMWTVTLKVLPIVVMAHLICGMAIACLLCWLMQSSKQLHPVQQKINFIRPWAIFGLMILILQIFLGAWTSTNYAGLVCPTFPFCHGSLLPVFDWKSAFNFANPIGPNYEGGRLAMDARITIQMAHRYGALITVLFWLPYALYLLFGKTTVALRQYGCMILALLLAQVLLGVVNVVKLLPMKVAVSHNLLAVLLLITVVALIHKLYSNRPERTC